MIMIFMFKIIIVKHFHSPIILKAEVYNCSNMTKVTTFDRISVDYAFKIIGE